MAIQCKLMSNVNNENFASIHNQIYPQDVFVMRTVVGGARLLGKGRPRCLV